MREKIRHASGFMFIVAIGILGHFIYELTGSNRLVGYFFPVRESVWEHLKLIFWPSMIWSVAEFFVWGKYDRDFFAVKMCSVFSALAFVVVTFYTYSGILGFTVIAIDIAIFIASALICQYVGYRLFLSQSSCEDADGFRGFVVLCLFGVCFAVWTYNPPPLGIFLG